MNDHPTPAELAAADAIDPRRYDGHTPGEWRWSFMGGSFNLNTPDRGRLIILDHFNGSFRFARRSPANRGGIMFAVNDRDSVLDFPDAILIEDAYLLPVVVHQRDEARALAEEACRRYNDLLAHRTVTCIYCGHAFNDGTPTSQDERLLQHTRTCEKHPLRAAEAERDALREKCRQLLLLAGVQEATIDEALAPPNDEPRREEE